MKSQQEFIALIKQRLADTDWLPRFPSFDLERWDNITQVAASDSSLNDEHFRVVSANQCEMLFGFIEAANPTLCKSFMNQNIVNRRMPRMVNLHQLVSNDSAYRFYHTIYPRARLSRDWNGCAPTPLESALLASLPYSMPLVQMDSTPLIFTVQQIGLLQKTGTVGYADQNTAQSSSGSGKIRAKHLAMIIEILIAGGADRRGLDNAGLSAYDHARILGLDDSMIAKLRPSNVFDGKLVAMPKPTYPPRLKLAEKPASSTRLRLQPIELVDLQVSGRVRLNMAIIGS